MHDDVHSGVAAAELGSRTLVAMRSSRRSCRRGSAGGVTTSRCVRARSSGGALASVRLLLWSAMLAFTAASTLCIALEEPQVRLERRQERMHVRVSVPLTVDATTAWGVLTDYNRLAEFVPDMQSSRVVSAPGEPTLLEQRGEAGLLFFRVAVNVVLEIRELPFERIAFRALSGNMKWMQGQWTLRREGAKLVLGYEAELEPDFWVPPLLGEMVMRTNVEKQVAGVVKEMERRRRCDRGEIQTDIRERDDRCAARGRAGT